MAHGSDIRYVPCVRTRLSHHDNIRKSKQLKIDADEKTGTGTGTAGFWVENNRNQNRQKKSNRHTPNLY